MPIINESNTGRRNALTIRVAAIVMLVIGILGGCRGGHDRTTDALRLRRGFGLAISARAPVMAAYKKLGRWPASNDEASIARPEKFATDIVSDLTVSAGGTITVHFKAGETLQVIPDARHIPVGSRWRCKTTNFENAVSVVPCRPAI
jgi:hypothetical protein